MCLAGAGQPGGAHAEKVARGKQVWEHNNCIGYPPHLFGSDGHTVIRRPSDLPRRLPALYARLTGGT